MKTVLLLVFLAAPFFFINSQEIGKMAEEPEPHQFPRNAFGVDVMFSEGGFGLGGFFRRQLDSKFTLFTDISISESKEDNEFEFFDIYGQSIVLSKVNRVFLLPLNLGIQYRIFENVIYDNLRPYLNAGVGPTMIVTTPFEKEFFSSFGKAKAHYAAGGYFGLGANFGLDKSSLIGLNFRYYVIRFFGDGIESLQNQKRQYFGGFYLTLNFGFMY
jgi:hypothetical protein